MHHIKFGARGDALCVKEAARAFADGRVVGYSSGKSIALLARLSFRRVSISYGFIYLNRANVGAVFVRGTPHEAILDALIDADKKGRTLIVCDDVTKLLSALQQIKEEHKNQETMTDNRNFGDIVGDVLAARKNEKQSKEDAKRAAEKADRAMLEGKFGALLTAIRQTKEKYPKMYADGYETGNEYAYVSKVCFYVSGDHSITVVYRAEPAVCRIIDDRKSPSVVAESDNVEDLLPPLIDLLAEAAEYSLSKR
jgi:rubrerythrin